MSESDEYTSEVTIENKLGFHVRPIQRFAELARAFECEVEVEIEGRKASGKSVLEMMSLKGESGAHMIITCEGSDARQCHCVLSFLAENRFFVEDQLDEELHPLRHLRRLATMSSCFDSSITATKDGESADAGDFEALKEMEITPRTSLEFDIEGPDAEQAESIMEKLLKYRFYVETTLNSSVQESE
mgnify:CR=1 FL=1